MNLSNLSLASLKSPALCRRNPLLILNESEIHVRKGSGLGSVGGEALEVLSGTTARDANDHNSSNRSMLTCSASVDEHSPAR